MQSVDSNTIYAATTITFSLFNQPIFLEITPITKVSQRRIFRDFWWKYFTDPTNSLKR